MQSINLDKFEGGSGSREFQQWRDLFALTLESRDGIDSFINMYETAVSVLKEATSVAVTDNALMRALLLHALQTDDFSFVKMEVMKDLEMTSKELIVCLREHSLVLSTETKFTNHEPGTLTAKAGIKSR